MSAYSEAAEGFVIGGQTMRLLSMVDSKARGRILSRAYEKFSEIASDPLPSMTEEMVATAILESASAIRDAFKARQEQSRNARRKGAGISRPSHDHLTTISRPSHDSLTTISRPSHDSLTIQDAHKEQKREEDKVINEDINAPDNLTTISRLSHDNLTMSKEREKESSPHTPFKERDKEIYNNNIYNKGECEGDDEGSPKPKARQPFKPPTVDEVKAYCVERGNRVDPDTFIDFYTAKNWFVGKNKMADWKAAVRTWERNRKDAGTWNRRTTPLARDERYSADLGEILG